MLIYDLPSDWVIDWPIYDWLTESLTRLLDHQLQNCKPLELDQNEELTAYTKRHPWQTTCLTNGITNLAMAAWATENGEWSVIGCLT